MSFPRRQFLHLAAGAAAVPVASRVATAQTYPSRPITIVVPFAAGGGLDVIARILAERMRVSLGQPVIIENVAGAAGSIGVGRVARAAPDGHTISIGQLGTHVLNGAVYALPYDLLTNFEPVSPIASYPWLIAAKKAMPADDLKGFIAWLKVNPDKASAGTSGAGSNIHLTGILFQKETGTRFQSVPYRGSGPALQDLVAGNIDILFDNVATAMPQMRAGRIKIFAVTAKNRLASAPEIPTVDEAGLPGFYVSSWYAFWVPSGTPKDVIAKLNSAAVDALADPSVRLRITDIGLEIFPREQQTPQALRALQKAEIEKWWPIIKEAGIKTE
jgi:tripartite-type tricarboxylate transporter receptor subunit TctC